VVAAEAAEAVEAVEVVEVEVVEVAENLPLPYFRLLPEPDPALFPNSMPNPSSNSNPSLPYRQLRPETFRRCHHSQQIFRWPHQLIYQQVCHLTFRLIYLPASRPTCRPYRLCRRPSLYLCLYPNLFSSRYLMKS
jgi:hypothetical protein